MVVLTSTRLSPAFFQEVSNLFVSFIKFLFNCFILIMILSQEIFGSIKLILCLAFFSGGYPEGGSKTLGNSLQMAFQWDKLAVDIG